MKPIANIAVLALLATLSCAPQAQDIFIGTVEKKGDQLELRRCDSVGNRYQLLDAPKAKSQPVRDLNKRFSTLTPPVYAEVIGVYQDRPDGSNALLVRSIDAVKTNKTCHLGEVTGSGKPASR